MNWALILPLAIKFVGWLLDKAKASEDTKRKFIELVNSAQNDGLIAIQAKDEFQKQKDQLH